MILLFNKNIFSKGFSDQVTFLSEIFFTEYMLAVIQPSSVEISIIISTEGGSLTAEAFWRYDLNLICLLYICCYIDNIQV